MPVFWLLLWLCVSCNHMPDHIQYVPKDASLVAGINLKSLSKKIAWNMITGSKLFKEMQKRMPQKNGTDAMGGIDKAGIDPFNTFYVYLKTDKRFNNGIKVTALVPLSSADDWEAYVKKNFPQSEIKQHNNIKETSLGNNMYMGWNKNLLIVINVIDNPQDFNGARRYYDYHKDGENGNDAQAQKSMTPEDMFAELDVAFSVANDNSIKGNKNFEKLQNDGHDLTMWINYEQIMNQYMTDGNMASQMQGLTLATAMWKDAAIACGFDFKKGKITGDLVYYSSGEMADIYKEFGATNASKDMIERLPSKNMDMMLALHLSPKGVKQILDKTGVLGLANSGLSAQDINVDKVLDAFTGDMAFVMNDLSVRNEAVANSGFTEQKTNVTMSYVLKINKKENFNKLLDIARNTGMLLPNGTGFVVPVSSRDSMFVVVNDEYAVASNKYADATAILQGTFKGNKMPESAAQIFNHPFAMYFDIQQTLKDIEPGRSLAASDSFIYQESRKLLTDFSINGGDFRNNAMEIHVEVNFTNTDESSIIALLDFGMKISDALQKKQVQESANTAPNAIF